MARALRRAPAALGVLLATTLVIGLFSHGYAQARPAPSPEAIISMVICGDGGTETIYIDAAGNPVAPHDCLHELCEACLSSVSHAGVEAFGPLSPVGGVRALDHPPIFSKAPFLRPIFTSRPRGPPLPPEAE